MPDTILFSTRSDGSDEKLADAFREAHPDIRLCRCACIEDLLARLRGPQHGLLAVICMADNAGTLEDLSEIRDFFSGLNLILILPDQDRAVLSHGLKLFPRYVAYENHGLSDLLLVVDKMKKNAMSTKRFHSSPCAPERSVMARR